MGFPKTDELPTADVIGRYNEFENGAIYYSPDWGALALEGPIWQKWMQLGRERGFLGYPIRDHDYDYHDARGHSAIFENGEIFWTPTTGAYEVHGAILSFWGRSTVCRNGRCERPLGFPTTDELSACDGVTRYSRFERGTISWHPSRGAWLGEPPNCPTPPPPPPLQFFGFFHLLDASDPTLKTEIRDPLPYQRFIAMVTVKNNLNMTSPSFRVRWTLKTRSGTPELIKSIDETAQLGPTYPSNSRDFNFDPGVGLPPGAYDLGAVLDVYGDGSNDGELTRIITVTQNSLSGQSSAGNAQPSFSILQPDASQLSVPVPVVRVSRVIDLSSPNLITLDGTLSVVPAGRSAAFVWRQIEGPIVSLSASNSATPSFVLPQLEEATRFVFSLSVDDGVVQSEPATLIVTALPNGPESVWSSPWTNARVRKADFPGALSLPDAPYAWAEIEASSDLRAWTVLGTLQANGFGKIAFLDRNAGQFPNRFYRAKETTPPVETETNLATVLNLNDSGPGSLRQALLDVPAGGSIRFATNVAGELRLAEGELAIQKNVSIAGPGSGALAIVGNSTQRLFSVGAGVEARISGLTLRGGGVQSESPAEGGCIHNLGSLSVLNCLLRDNSVLGQAGTSGSAAFGGALFNGGTAVVANCTFANNFASGGIGASPGAHGELPLAELSRVRTTSC